MGINSEKSVFNQLMDALSKIDELMKSLKKYLKEIKNLNSLINDLKQSLSKKDEIIKKQQLEIERLKTNNKKDSSNSGKPSGTNGFKKVITNRRVKSNRKKGGQVGHQFYSLSEDKVQELIAKGAVVEPIVEVNKNDSNANLEYKTVKIINIKTQVTITEYRYYQDEAGNYNIPGNIIQPIIYGDSVKGLAMTLMNQFPNSTDGVKGILRDITNDGINVSKGVLINWNDKLATNLAPEIDNIENELLSSYYVNCDESGIKINGESYNLICASNKTHTRLWTSEQRTHDALKMLTFFVKFIGVIVKDGTDIYNGFGRAFAQCISHILRYLKGVYEFIDRKEAKEMSKFLQKCIDLREELKGENIWEFDEATYNKLIAEYDDIIKRWKKEWMKDSNNPVYDDERKLLARMEDSDKEQILYFLKDFKVPATNNQAEADERPVKIKQKIGKFRSVDGADNYTIIRSCVNTYKKNNVNVLGAFISAFAGNPVII